MSLFPTRDDVAFVAELNLDGLIGRLTTTWIDADDVAHRHVTDWPYGAQPEQVAALAHDIVRGLVAQEVLSPF